MPARVFISCGQATNQERAVGASIKEWLESADAGFSAYIAIQEQDIQDLNSTIVDNLVDSDYFLFVDFKREWLGWKRKSRGSLFSHQELALAYYLGFRESIFLKQTGVELNGFSKYIMKNPIEFGGLSEVLDKVKDQVRKRRWSRNCSRHLVAGGIGGRQYPIPYSDHISRQVVPQYIWACRIDNKRIREPALNAVAVLKQVKFPDGRTERSRDMEFLKWAGSAGYSRTILPESHASFDLLGIPAGSPTEVYLHSYTDISPRQPIITGVGTYFLTHQVCAQNIPLLDFTARLVLERDLSLTRVEFVPRSTESMTSPVLLNDVDSLEGLSIDKALASGSSALLPGDEGCPGSR